MPWLRERLKSLTSKPWRLAIIAAIVLAHAGIAWWLIQVEQVLAPPEPTPPMEVVLWPPRPPEDPPADPAPEVGGGGPAQPSVVRTPPEPVEVEPEIPAPIEPAEEQAPLVGVAPIESPNPGFGLGGQGTGTGTGIGSGAGPGTGGTERWRVIRGPSQVELGRFHPRAAIRRGLSGQAMITCRIRGQRLTECRADSESPPGLGFGRAAVASAPLFVVRPPYEDGVPVDGAEVSIGVTFDLPP
ncbi:energy transducer TonB [Brevundimonas lutea]|uniref:energy transducer TonB n=1 Tax=Brevundimonas lutea TaxID=2293980 RepID=UPI000F02808A|nr:energy transducer TonB [Brevundimonas lutea]